MAAQAYIISKLINNNIVFSTDASGDEIILFGKAIGFGKKRGDAVPADQVLRVFRAASGQERKFLTNLVEDIDSVYIDLAGEITALFEQQLQIKVNDILLISLSDHISNAVFNKKEGLDVPLDILPQIIGIYPVEYAIARQGLDLIEERTGVRLSPDEAGYIVLHYINCQGKDYRGDGKYRLLFQEKMVQNVEDYYHVTLNRSSLYYHRFLTHLNFLAARIHDGELSDSPDSLVYDLLIEKYPDLLGCIQRCDDTIRTNFSVAINSEEKGYLALHIANMLRAIHKERSV